MRAARIAELLEPFLVDGAVGDRQPMTGGPRLTASDLERISTYIDILLRWNARINLTAIRDPEQIVTRHFGESFFAARHLFPPTTHGAADALVRPPARRMAADHIIKTPLRHERAALHSQPQAGAACRGDRVPGSEEDRTSASEVSGDDEPPASNDRITLADLGSGAGFPGLPIKLWAPHISLTLIESNHKKAAFLREIARALTFTDVNILTARAETLTGLTFDVVTLRAVERFDQILPIAARLVARNGRLSLLIGSSQQSLAVSRLPGFAWSDPEPIPLSQSRILMSAHGSNDSLDGSL
jgi:16S rRNA G527 N7-methylase RsmG